MGKIEGVKFVCNPKDLVELVHPDDRMTLDVKD